MLGDIENEMNAKFQQIRINGSEDSDNNGNWEDFENTTEIRINNKWRFSDFSIGRRIAQGTFGGVYLAREKCHDRVVALKILFKSDIEMKNYGEQLKSEIEIHTRLRHENIIRMWACFHDESRVFMVMDVADKGDLCMALEAEPSRRFNDIQTISVILQLTNAMKFIHNKGIIHRDIKPENLLVAANDQVKLGDFGWAVCHRNGQRLPPCGIRNNMAPEMFNNDHFYDYTVDLWAIGVLAYHLIVGMNPFISEDEGMIEKICTADYFFPSFVSQDCEDFITQLIVLSPHQRLHLDDIPRHKWTCIYE